MKDTHSKISENKSKNKKGPIQYKDDDPQDPTGSKHDISTPKKNSGYDEKQPGQK